MVSQNGGKFESFVKFQKNSCFLQSTKFFRRNSLGDVYIQMMKGYGHFNVQKNWIRISAIFFFLISPVPPF